MAQTAKKNAEEFNDDVSKQMAILRDDIASLTATVAEYGKAQGMAAVVAQRAVRASMAQRKAQGGKRTGQELKGCEQVVVKNVLR